jgi:hypothetical protein
MVLYWLIIIWNKFCFADLGGGSFQGVRLQSLDFWDYRFELQQWLKAAYSGK